MSRTRLAGIEDIDLRILIFDGFVGVGSRLKASFYIISNPKSFQVKLDSFPSLTASERISTKWKPSTTLSTVPNYKSKN